MTTRPRTIASFVLLGILVLLLFLPDLMSPVVRDLTLVRDVRSGEALTAEQFTRLERRLADDAPLGEDWVAALIARITSADLSRALGADAARPNWHDIARRLRERRRLPDDVWTAYVSRLADVLILSGDDVATAEAWREIRSLHDAGALPSEADERLGELALIAHQKLDDPADLEPLIVALRSRGELPDALWRAFLRQVLDVSLTVPAEVRTGDSLSFSVDVSRRGGGAAGPIETSTALVAVLVDGTEVAPQGDDAERVLDGVIHVPAVELPPAGEASHSLTVVLRVSVRVREPAGGSREVDTSAPALLAPAEWTEEHSAVFRVRPAAREPGEPTRG